MNGDFWTGKRVLITGHTGFKGSWMSLCLQRMGTQVIGYALAPHTQPNLFEVADIAKGMQASLCGDIRDLGSLKKVILQYKPEIVIHMAAQALVRYAYQNPVETYATNVLGTVHVMEAIRQCGGVKVLINVTSDKCYDNKESMLGYRETDPMGGFDPYSSSKGCAELVTSAYRNSFFSTKSYARHGVAVASVRAGNVIGGGDWAKDRLIPDCMRMIAAGDPVVIRNPKTIRPWQYVLEPIYGYLTLAEKLWDRGPQYAEAWNFGPDDNDAQPVSWIVDQLIQLWGQGPRWEMDKRDQPHETACLKLDCSKANTRLGWKPRLHLSFALEWIVEWYQNYFNKGEMRQFTELQISRFESMEAL